MVHDPIGVSRRFLGTLAGCLILTLTTVEDGSMLPKTDQFSHGCVKKKSITTSLSFLGSCRTRQGSGWHPAAKQCPAAEYMAKMDSDTHLSPATRIGDLVWNEKGYPVVDYCGVFLDGGMGGFTPEDHCDTAMECRSPPSGCGCPFFWATAGSMHRRAFSSSPKQWRSALANCCRRSIPRP